MRKKHLIAAAVGTLLVAAVAGGVAYATIPSDTNVVTVCMLRNVGTVRLIDPSLPSNSLLGRCTSLETQLSWNQKGQPGSPGLAGPAGKDGANGKDGIDGKDGVDGKDGQPGLAGSKGDSGGMSGYELVHHTFTLFPGQRFFNENVSCPAGKVILGGGSSPDTMPDGLKVYGGTLEAPSPPFSAGYSFWPRVTNDSAVSISVRVSVACANSG